MTGDSVFRPCAVVPVYNHYHHLPGIVDFLHNQELPVFLVDDGSDPETRDALQKLAESRDDIRLSRLSWNQGKGAAVMDGLVRAKEAGFTHGVQVDADGQHDLGALQALLNEARQHPDALISGTPEYDDSAPLSRVYGRRITRFWVWVETLSTEISDAMIGFRVYPLDSVCRLIDEVDLTRRMDFDIEVVVRMNWEGVPVRSVPVRIFYPEDGVSHFHAVRDNIRISLLHTRLCMGTLVRLPQLLRKRFQKQDQNHWSNIQERGSELGIRILLSVYRLFGHKIFSLILMPVMAYYFATGRSARQASLEYLQKLHQFSPDSFQDTPGLKTSFRHFISFGHTLADRFAAWSGSVGMNQLTVNGREPIEQRLANGEGVVLLVSHLGNVELCRALADLNTGDVPLRINVLVHTRHALTFNRVMEKVNPDSNVRLIQVDSIGPDTSIMLSDMIDRGEMVAIAADRLPEQDAGVSLEANFLGERARLPKGPFILASILRCPVFTLFCTRTDASKYRLDVELFADPLVLPRKQREQHLSDAAQTFADRLGAACQRAPLEWFNFFSFWHIPGVKDDA